MDYRYLLSLGSNLGHRHSHLLRGIQLLSCEVRMRRISRIMETTPLTSSLYETSEHEPYLNCVVECESDREALELYEEVIRPIEDMIGHSRVEKWQPRELDIDILFWAQNDGRKFDQCSVLQIKQEDSFQVPHQAVWSRSFLLDLITSDLNIDAQRLHRRL